MNSTRNRAANRTKTKAPSSPKPGSAKARPSTPTATTCGFATQAVRSELGESPEEFTALYEQILEQFEIVGPLERALGDRIAVLIWRQRRTIATEAAISVRITRDLPPDPTTIAPVDIHPNAANPADPAPAIQLAFTRRMLEYARLDSEAAAFRMKVFQPDQPDTLSIGCLCGKEILAAAGVEFGWEMPFIDAGQWQPFLEQLGVSSVAEECSFGAIRQAIRDAAAQSGLDAEVVLSAAASRCAGHLARCIEIVEGREREEADWVALLKADRQRAQAAALADSGPCDSIIRLEAHLSSELERALAVLETVQARRRAALK